MRADVLARLPALAPVVVVDEDEMEELLRRARAEVAERALALRSLLREEAALQAAVAFDASAARDLLLTALDESKTARAVELANGLATERADAVERIAAARRDADALVAAAWGEVMAALGGDGAGVPDEPAPAGPQDPTEDVAAPATVAAAPAPAAPAPQGLAPPAVALPANAPAPAASPAVSGAVPRASWARYLYADVVLPVIAVLVVVMVLLAWVG